MRARYVVDTNVLIAASAVEAGSPVARDATPREPALRQRVHDWLTTFEVAETRMVLDGAGKIYEEYGNKLGFNDYGIQLVIHKMSTAAVDLVEVLYDRDGHGVLEPSLASVIHDRADRKLVAAALAANSLFGACAIANAGDTDWYDWHDALTAAGVAVEQLLPEWSRQKWQAKRARGAR
ncbi:MAG: hypothetical protein ACYDA8_10235 [Deferrisomatales bacterium]